MPKTRNNHARTDKKVKALKQKSFWKRVIEKRMQKLKAQQVPKGKTIRLKSETDKMQNYAVDYSVLFPDGGWYPQQNKRYPNQRQRRKRMAQNPHLRKKLSK